MKTTDSLLERHRNQVKEYCKEIAEALIERNWPKLMDAMDDQQADGEKFGFSIKIDLPASFPQQVKTKLRYSTSKSDDVDVTLPDPNQPDLPLDDDPPEQKPKSRRRSEKPSDPGQKALPGAQKALQEPEDSEHEDDGIIDVDAEEDGE